MQTMTVLAKSMQESVLHTSLAAHAGMGVVWTYGNSSVAPYTEQFYAGGALNFEELTVADCAPSMTDLRLITLSLKKQLVKPRVNGRYHVIASPEFYFDMISDPTVQAYMAINQTTKTMFDDSQLVPMFGMEFYEALTIPTSSEFVKNGVVNKRLYRLNDSDDYEYMNMPNDMVGDQDGTYVKKVSGGMSKVAAVDMKKTVSRVMKEVERGKSVPEIASRLGLDEELAEQICRLYLTHPGVTADQILTKMGL